MTNYLYPGWKDETRQKAFEADVRVKNLTQKVEIPRENKNSSLKCLSSHTSSLQSRYRQFSILGLTKEYINYIKIIPPLPGQIIFSPNILGLMGCRGRGGWLGGANSSPLLLGQREFF